jgi:hypothetical protein
MCDPVLIFGAFPLYWNDSLAAERLTSKFYA